MRNFFFILISFIVPIFMPHLPASAQSLQQDWQNSIMAARKDNKLVGLGGAILHNGETVALAVSGVQVKGQDAPITKDDLWHIGSITKSMTATMIARLVEQDKMRWDMKLADVFGDMNMHEDWQNITLHQLLTHTSGAQANFPLSVMFSWQETQDEIDTERWKAVKNVLEAPIKSTDKKFVYSNVGYTIAGAMAEKITRKPWEVLMREEVFEPLGLGSAGFGPPMPAKDIPQPWGHRKIFGIAKTAMDPTQHPDNPPIMGPAGTVHMNLSDMLRYANAHLQGDLAHRGGLKDGANKPYLQPSTWKRLHTENTNEYAYGWVVPKQRKWADGRVIWHNGSNTMWYAVIAIAPNKNAVFAFATNDGDTKKADKAFGALLSEFGVKLK